MYVKLSDLKQMIFQLLQAVDLSKENAEVVCDVFIRATLRGNRHHDIYSFPDRIINLISRNIKPNPCIQMVHKYRCMENYEGDNGLGELCGMFIIKQAIHLADEYGIGFCAIRNTNHILASTPYVEVAAENGYIGYIVTRGAPTMGAPGRKEKVIGTSPMGYAIPTEMGYPIMFDACVAYASNGVLAEKAKAGERVPSYWGLDQNGNYTSEPTEIIKGTRLPIGGHKGFGITILGEIITGILAEGQVIDEPQSGTGDIGKPSHTAICIKPDGLLGQDVLEHRATEMVNRMRLRAANLQIPGQHSYENKTKILNAGVIELKDELVGKMNDLAELLGVTRLQYHAGENANQCEQPMQQN